MALTLADCLARKENDLAAVRILAATAVLHAHAWIVCTPGLSTEGYFHVLDFSLDFHGVHAFFILSGLLLTRSLMDRPDTLRFVVARLVRYLPGIFVSAMVAALIVGPIVTDLPLSAYFGSGGPIAFVAKITSLINVNATLPGVFEQSARPGILYIPLWTIHYELVFALIIAAAWALGLLRVRAIALVGLAAVLALNVVWFWNGEQYAYLGSPHHLVRFASTFGIGIVLALYAERIPVSNAILAAIAIVAVPLAFSHVAALAGMVLLAYAILCIGFCGGPVAAALAKLGVWSYGFYVSGYLIEQIIAWAAPTWSGWAIFALALPLSLAAGAASWRVVERPCIARTGYVTAAIRRRVSFRRSAEPSVPLGGE